MKSLEEQIVNEIKPYINKGDINRLKEQWLDYYSERDFGREIAWDFVFQKVYLHAALKKQKEICKWLDTIFTQFNPLLQLALRQMFSYARYLLQK